MTLFPRHPRGFTLVELLMTSAIVSVALLGMVRLFFGEINSFTNNWIEFRKFVLAQDMMDTVRALKWDETGPAGQVAVPSAIGLDGGEPTVANADDIDDYHQFTDVPVPNFTRSVTVTYVGIDATGLVTPAGGPTPFKNISVRVVHPSRPAPITLSLVMANTAP